MSRGLGDVYKRQVIVKGNYTYKIKKLSENYYAITPYYENEIPKEAHEIYDYLIENL